MKNLSHSMNRSIVIRAERSIVFRFFTDSALFADWWGAGSEIDGRQGGAIHIQYPNGIIASGEVLEINPEERIVFTFGYPSGDPMPPGSSRVTFTFSDHEEGTMLNLLHEFEDEKARDEHVQGWRYQLSVFANSASRFQNKDFEKRIESYFDMWNELDGDKRKRDMDGLLADGIQFQDAYSCTSGKDDLNAHISAGKKFMPGLTLKREEDARFCQGTATVSWTAVKKDGSIASRGMNVFDFSHKGLIRAVTGFWMAG